MFVSIFKERIAAAKLPPSGNIGRRGFIYFALQVRTLDSYVGYHLSIKFV